MSSFSLSFFFTSTFYLYLSIFFFTVFLPIYISVSLSPYSPFYLLPPSLFFPSISFLLAVPSRFCLFLCLSISVSSSPCPLTFPLFPRPSLSFTFLSFYLSLFSPLLSPTSTFYLHSSLSFLPFLQHFPSHFSIFLFIFLHLSHLHALPPSISLLPSVPLAISPSLSLHLSHFHFLPLFISLLAVPPSFSFTFLYLSLSFPPLPPPLSSSIHLSFLSFLRLSTPPSGRGAGGRAGEYEMDKYT